VRISVVIPYYNRSRFIDACLDSVFAQTLAPDEVIVVDDASRPEETQHLERKGASIRLVRLLRNRGVSGARNAGIAVAQGEWIAFQDSDDLWEPDKLARQWRHLEANPECDGVQSAVRAVYDDGREIVSDAVAPRLTLADALHHNMIRTQTLVIRARVVRALGGFDETLRLCEDDDLGIRLAAGGHRIDFLAEPLVRLRRGDHAHLFGDWRKVLAAKTRVALRHRALLEEVLGPGATRRRIALTLRKSGEALGGIVGRSIQAGGWVLGGFDPRTD